MMKRLTTVGVALAVAMTGICTRLFWISQSELQTASDTQSSRRQTVAVARGTVYDRYLQPLVNDTDDVIAFVSPFRECVNTMRQTLEEPYRRKVCDQLALGDCVRVATGHWLPPQKGIIQMRVPLRYSEEAIAPHVIGYINGEGSGVTGIEKSFDDVLSAYQGTADVILRIDALGQISNDAQCRLENTLALSAGGVVLSLDRQLQELTQKAATAYLERGAVIVTDVKSGEVLASVSLPLYDPSDVEAALTDPASPLLDRTRINYNCGSVFKILVAAAALEQGVSPQMQLECTGAVNINGIRFHCHNALGDGIQTMKQALARSCNCYFIQLAQQIGADAVYSMAMRAGFTEALTLTKDIKTAVAIMPSRRDLSADAALANVAIGQGDLLATPYHVSLLMQAVANDGICVFPSLLCGVVDENGVLVRDPSDNRTVRLFSAQTAFQLRDMLCAVVESGTGIAAAPQRATAAGKTGTAETGWEIDGEEVVQSWFVGCYPANDPQYIITVLSENGGVSGKTAAPLFAKIADAFADHGLVENSQDWY